MSDELKDVTRIGPPLDEAFRNHILSTKFMFDNLCRYLSEQPAPESTVQPCEVAAANHSEADE